MGWCGSAPAPLAPLRAAAHRTAAGMRRGVALGAVQAVRVHCAFTSIIDDISERRSATTGESPAPSAEQS